LSVGTQKATWDVFFRALAPTAGERILDIGAGKGSLAYRVLKGSNGAEVYAVDPSEKRVASMRRDYPELKTSVAAAESLPYSDSYFDKVYTTMALHHYADLDRALKEIGRVLRSSGSFVILEVDPSSVQGRVFRFFGKVTGEHMNLMNEEQLVSRLRVKEGFNVADSVKLKSVYLIRAVRV
jgi:ubiquinone/menaquinone biosynthesis C-methylase UbiE